MRKQKNDAKGGAHQSARREPCTPTRDSGLDSSLLNHSNPHTQIIKYIILPQCKSSGDIQTEFVPKESWNVVGVKWGGSGPRWNYVLMPSIQKAQIYIHGKKNKKYSSGVKYTNPAVRMLWM